MGCARAGAPMIRSRFLKMIHSLLARSTELPGMDLYQRVILSMIHQIHQCLSLILFLLLRLICRPAGTWMICRSPPRTTPTWNSM